MRHGWPVLAMLAMALTLIPACGGDDGGGGGGTKPPTVINVKPGGWLVTTTLVPQGGSGCPNIQSIFSQQCYLTGEQVDAETLIGGQGIRCDVSVAGNSLNAACNGQLPYGTCVYTYNGGFSGTLSADRSSITMSGNVVLSIQSGPPACGSGTCTVRVTLVGSWVGETCPEDKPGASLPEGGLLGAIYRMLGES